MKRVLFILSHLCSGSDSLYRSLDDHPKIQGFRSSNLYENRLSLVTLTSQSHKLDDASAIYMDELLHNSSIGDISIYPECHYIFVIRDAIDTINEIISVKNYKPRHAVNYYKLRLRRLYAIARRSPRSVMLTFSDLEAGRGGDLIQDYLQLRDPVIFCTPQSLGLDNVVDSVLIEEAQHSFEVWLYNMKQLGLMAIRS